MPEAAGLSGWSGAVSLAVAGIGTVFLCLLLVYIFFTITGRVMARYGARAAAKAEAPAAVAVPAGAETPGAVVAAIALALAQMRRTGGARSEPPAAAGIPWKDQGRSQQHQRSRFWEQR